jgi:anti-sigma B factor antagonist
MAEVARTRRAQLSVTAEDGLVVRLGGELDIASLPDVQQQLDGLLDREPQPVRLDLADLEFMDSSGVAVLLRIANRFQPVRMRQPRPAVRRVVEALGLADRLGLDRT